MRLLPCCSRSLQGRLIRSNKFFSLFWDLCLLEAAKKLFFFVIPPLPTEQPQQERSLANFAPCCGDDLQPDHEQLVRLPIISNRRLQHPGRAQYHLRAYISSAEGALAAAASGLERHDSVVVQSQLLHKFARVQTHLRYMQAQALETALIILESALTGFGKGGGRGAIVLRVTGCGPSGLEGAQNCPE